MDPFFGLDRISPHDENLELLETVTDGIRFSMIRGLLEEAKIPYLVKERGSGSSVRVIAGFSMYGTDIFVRREMLEEARGLVEAYLSATDISDESDAEENA